MASIEENILKAIKAKGRGSIFFPSDFTLYGKVKAVRKSLYGTQNATLSVRIYIYILRLQIIRLF